MRSSHVILLSLIVLAALLSQAQDVRLPVLQDGLRFAVIGDTGTGGKAEYEIAQRVTASRPKFPFDLVVMAGDNLYGSESPKDFETKFEKPYRNLLASGVKFYATLGNHDDPSRQISYKYFNMGGKQYYSFKPKAGIRFFCLNSNYMDTKQLTWFENELKASGSEWKIVFFHHPLYSSGEKHGSNIELRASLEPLMVHYGVDVVLTGHEHFYERIKPQKKINYFIVGSSAKLREGNITKTDMTARGFDQDNVFMLAQIAGDEMSFQTISRTGKTIDSGTIKRAEQAQMKTTTPTAR